MEKTHKKISILFLVFLAVGSYLHGTSLKEDFSVMNAERSTENKEFTANYSSFMDTDPRNCGEVTVGPAVSACAGRGNTIGGTVYEDLNYNGDLDASDENGLGGIIVQLFDEDEQLEATAITDASGNYLFRGTTDASYRIEFSIPESICWAKPSVAGANSNTLVQKVAPGNCYNLGIFDPLSYCGDNPNLAATCFLDGEPLLGGTSGEGDVLVAYPYNNPTGEDIKKVAINKEIGTAWGLAYDKQTQDFYTGAMLKRHAGFGPLGTSGIYKINYSDPANPVVENWLNVSDLGVDVGNNPRNYQLPATSGLSNIDPVAFSKVGKVGFGDVDLSPDGKTLYAMNLNNNGSLVIIDVPSKTLIAEVPVKNPGCGADTDVRPWGIEIHGGEVYIGLVCSGQAGGSANFNFFVLQLNGTSFDEVFSSSLDYEKGFVYPRYNADTPAEADICGRWEPWTDDFSELHHIGVNTAGTRLCRPQPILSDIEFDNDGSMILAFMDRTGHQTGFNQYGIATGTDIFNGYVGGDILRVDNNNGTFELENAGTTANGGGCGANGEGPGGGEYYCGENFETLHLENSLGAIAFNKYDDNVVINLMDPFAVFSGGTGWLNNSTGQQTSALELYNSHPGTINPEIGTFGKAAGLGDLELVCESAPIEIGNIVWEDSNGDGIQNASEAGMDRLEVELIKDGEVVATTITENDGQYYFSDTSATNQTWLKGVKVLPYMDYIVRLSTTQFSSKIGVTNPAIDSSGNSFIRDNDARFNEGKSYLEIALKTGDFGCTDHNYDFGITPGYCLGNLVWEDTNNDGLFNNGEKGIPDVCLTVCKVGPDGLKGTEDDTEIAQTKTDKQGNYLFTNLASGEYFVKLIPNQEEIMLSSTGTGIFGTAPITYEPAVDPDVDTENEDKGTQMGESIMSGIITLADIEPSTDVNGDPNTNLTLDFGLFKSLTIGNKVWKDDNNNGLLDAAEKGVNGVSVALYQLGSDGVKGTADDILMETTKTGLTGCYEFNRLHPGEYWVKLIGGIPVGMVSSDGNGKEYTGAGFYESGVDPDDVEVDSDDNGQQMGSMIMSEPISLVIDQEPINDFDAKSNTNTTVDFALFPVHQIMLYDPCNCLGNGEFSDKVVILSTVPSEKWTLKSGNGIYDLNSSTESAIPTGTMLMEDGVENGKYRYILDLKHKDGEGYSACFTNGISNLDISNLCNADKSCVQTVLASSTATPVPVLDTCAQNFIMGHDGVMRADTLKCCDSKSTFSDDGTIDGLYADTSSRTDLYTICSPDQWKVLTFFFDDFDVAPDDTLYVYDGKTTSDPLIGKYSGSGVSQTGGWLSGSCDPSINNSGCLTFEFKTNGDNSKGRGWTGNFECNDRNIALKAPFATANLSCSETVKTFTFKPAPVTADCGVVKDTQHIRIYNALGKLCKEETIGGTQTFTEKFGIGNYLVIYQLKSDTVKADTAVITVQEAALVCNDKVTVPLGPVCSVTLTPDDLLENPCDTILDTAYYYITLEYTDKEGKTQTVSGGGKGGNYPKVSKEMLDSCGGDIKATIERRYYEGLTLDVCNNGVYSVACDVTVDIIDQSIPLIAALSEMDTFVMCDIDLTQEGLGLTTPKAVDNCSEATVTFESAKILNEGETACDTTKVEVTWKAADNCGNSDLATQRIVYIRPTLNEIVKTGPVTLACDSDETSTKIPGFKVGKLVDGVVIPSDTIDLDTINYVCGYILQKRSVEIPSVDCIRKTYQYWSIVDWCAPESGVQVIDTTRIEYIDSEAPEFAAESGPNRTLALDHFSCTYDITQLDNQPTATDNCSEPTVRLAKVSRIVDGELSEIDEAKWTELDCDSFQLDWIAEDGCLKQLINDTLEQIVEIKDSTNPAPVCTDKINVSISNHDVTLHYTDIDAGSYDACGIVKYEISRDQVNWGPTVTFTCEDIHKEIQVSLRVTDKKDNQASCWAVVLVEDKIAPVCNSIKDVKVDCDKYHNGELGTSTDQNQDGKFDDDDEWVKMSADQIAFYNAEFGEPDCFDNAACNELLIQQEYQLVEKSCGIFHAKRRYRAIDWNGEGQASNWAEQQIEAEPKAFWSITFPADWVGECDDDIPTDNQLFLSNGTCELLGYEVEERTFTTVEDACLKVVRTYTLTNWCVYKEGDDTYEVKRDENQHGIVEHDSTLTSTGLEEVSRLEYVQILKLQDYTAPEIVVEAVDDCINGLECGASKSFAITATDCNEAATQALNYSWTISSNGTQLDDGEGTSFSHDVVPNVTYEVYWKVTDNCGNTATKNESYTFKDCRKPAPYCIHGIAVELMQGTGMVQVWASDVERGSTDNCTPKDKLSYRLWHKAIGEAPTDLAGVRLLSDVITLNCATLGEQDVNLYVIDEAGNWDFCTTTVDVQDNMNACGNIEPTGMAAVSGIIKDWNNKSLESVAVNAMDDVQSMTNADGSFEFELAMNSNYTIQPEKNTQPLNGVSTFDLVLISKHILGISTFDNPYQIIAADVNKSGTITAFDMVQTRQLILNIKSEFSNNTSWRFVDAAYEFTTDQPLAENFPEVMNISDLQHDMNANFVAVKIGDVNGSARTNALIEAEGRAAKAFEISVEDMEVKAGQTYQLDFTTNQLQDIQGYQFTLAYDNLKLNKLQEGVAGVENFGLHRIADGFITTSWNKAATNSQTNAIEVNAKLFSIDFTALHDGQLSEQLSILNRPTPVEAYDQSGELMDIELNFTKSVNNDKYLLFQNTPNPFNDETTIGFYLPGNSEVELILRDEMGRLIHSFKGNYPKGTNNIKLDKGHLSNGLIYYQLSTKFGTQAKKMLILE